MAIIQNIACIKKLRIRLIVCLINIYYTVLQVMFSNSYQNGPILQVWDAKVNVDKNPFYKQLFRVNQNTVCKYFDKEVKNYVYSLTGQNARLSMPGEDNKLLSLHQRYLVLQIFIPIGFNWSLQLGISDLLGIKRRINFTTVQGKEQIKYFSFRYPLIDLAKGNWMFLGIDVYSFMSVFSNQTFRSLDQIIVGSECRLRRIFTMKQFVEWQIPKNYWMSSQKTQQLQLICLKDSQKEEVLKMSNRQLTESTSSPKKNMSKKQYNNDQQTKMPIQLSQKSGVMRRGDIIEQARKRLNSLEKQQEKIINKSKLYEKKSVKVNQQQQQNRLVLQRSEHIQQFSKPPKQNKTKLPNIEKSFKEDLALSRKSQEESNDSHSQKRNYDVPKQYQTRQIIDQDKWSDHDQAVKKPKMEEVKNRSANFPSTVITKENTKEVFLQKNNSHQIQLIYDEMVGCYYHPETNSYYELKK